MNEDIEWGICRCEICQAYQRANAKEPFLPHPIHDRPWEKLGMDILEFAGKSFIIIVDNYCKWVQVKLLGAKSAVEVIKKFEDVFAVFGSSHLVISDNVLFNSYESGSSLSAENLNPHFPRANRLAEKAVDIVKRMLCNVTECQIHLSLAIIEYRNTPIARIGLSPSQMLLHCHLKFKIPTHSDLLKPHIQTYVPARLRTRQDSQKYYFDRSSKSLPDLCPGKSVRIQKGNKWAPAAVLSRFDAPRS
ncbi:hypothetical protein PR048_015426 [Dryococelus australis]|uniref:Integrase catalytic domain-containing protein n=1 Tax=Dryococelus australis TaxID=614101 RepID=A0ABQ9HH71_9NEOP|nr:hypothetical protein PR048_015426 [Dryococelus australis]